MSTIKQQYCHLHLHTDYSLLDGAIQHEPLARRAAELGMTAAAITDHGNLFGAISFYNTMKSAGVKRPPGQPLPIVTPTAASFASGRMTRNLRSIPS